MIEYLLNFVKNHSNQIQLTDSSLGIVGVICTVIGLGWAGLLYTYNRITNKDLQNLAKKRTGQILPDHIQLLTSPRLELLNHYYLYVHLSLFDNKVGSILKVIKQLGGIYLGNNSLKAKKESEKIISKIGTLENLLKEGFNNSKTSIFLKNKDWVGVSNSLENSKKIIDQCDDLFNEIEKDMQTLSRRNCGLKKNKWLISGSWGFSELTISCIYATSLINEIISIVRTTDYHEFYSNYEHELSSYKKLKLPLPKWYIFKKTMAWNIIGLVPRLFGSKAFPMASVFKENQYWHLEFHRDFIRNRKHIPIKDNRTGNVSNRFSRDTLEKLKKV